MTMTETATIPALSGASQAGKLQRRASDLAATLPPMTPGNTNGDVSRFFHDHPGIACLPVVEAGVPIGLINRSIFLGGLSLPFHREVYERKSCIAFMDKRPLVVDSGMPIEMLGRMAVEAGGKTLGDGFIVTREGQYLGHGSGISLLKALGALETARNQVIHESIAYAQVIQSSLLATSIRELASAGLADHHVLWEPRDTVGGDAFFARRCERDGRKGLFVALMDCTGHGVPGAFTAMLMTSFLGHALDRAKPWEPGDVLADVNLRMKDALGQRHQEEGQGDAVRADEGMDVTSLWLDAAAGECVFAGARHSLWLLRPGGAEVEEVKGDRMGVGYIATPDDYAWKSRIVACPPRHPGLWPVRWHPGPDRWSQADLLREAPVLGGLAARLGGTVVARGARGRLLGDGSLPGRRRPAR